MIRDPPAVEMDWNETAWSDREHGTISEEEQEAMEAYAVAMRWHRGKILYICMETSEIQRAVFI